MMCTEQNAFVKIMFMNGLHIGLPVWPWIKKVIEEKEYTDSMIEQKFSVQWSVK